MNSCGKQFHTEAGKFRFLNELIKVLSPKYLGTWSSEKVKEKVTEVLYGWTVWLPDEVKIKEAYQMLKKQGIVKKDPKLSEKILMAPLPPRTQGSVFDDEDKSKLLARLLKSTHPDDLQAANRLIKNTIKEEQEKMEKVSKRITAMEEVENNTKLLKEMLENYRRHRVSDSDRDIMKVRPREPFIAFPIYLAFLSESRLFFCVPAEILHANEKLTSVVNLYQELVKSREVNGHDPQSPKEIKSYHLIDLSELESLYPNSAAPGGASHDGNSSVSLLDEELMSLEESFSLGLISFTPVHSRQPSSFLGQSPGFSARVEEGRVGSILTMRVRLQSATSSELPAYNPLHPPAVISQVMLLSNPQKVRVSCTHCSPMCGRHICFAFGNVM
ncbi:GGA1 protein, partial [Amia calva]|nr:GGA1 protein [Amia calva]